MNNKILSFLGGFLDVNNFKSHLNYLPSNNPAGNFLTKDSFSFYFSECNNPLYDYLLFESDYALFFCSGFFYSEIDKKRLKDIFIKDSHPNNFLRIITKSINGSYNGFYLDMINKKIFLFSDFLGYEKIFFSKIHGKLVFSSFIWPLVQKTYKLNNYSISEHLIFGHSLGSKTIFKEISLIKPGHSNEINEDGQLLKTEDLFSFEKKGSDKLESLTENFFFTFRKHVTYIKEKLAAAQSVTTLTGGGETRVIMNGLLKTNETPVCITGSYPPSDVTRAKLINNLLNTKGVFVNYDDYLPNYKSHILDVIEISNGYTNGWWMSLISRASEKYGNHCYYGFSGDLIAGSMLLDLKKLSFERFVKLSFRYKSQYSILNPKNLLCLNNSRFSDIFENYLNTFRNYDDDLSGTAFNQEKNEMNYKRIASFADGCRLGSIPIWPFHDYNIIEFYRGLEASWLENEKMHKYLASYKNDLIKNISSTAKSNLSDSLLIILTNFIGKSNLIKLNQLKRKFNYLFKKEIIPASLKAYVYQEVPFIPQNMVDFDWKAFDKIINKSKISFHDYDLLTMRFADIILTLYLIENRKIYNNTMSFK